MVSLSDTIKNIFKKLRGEENRINFPVEYYQRTDDLRESLCKYKEAVELIKAKYEPYLLKGPQDIMFNSNPNQKTIASYKSKIRKKLSNELEYARLLTLYRLGDVTKSGLENLVRYAYTYDPKMTKEFKKRLNILRSQGRLMDVRNLARGKVANDLMDDIKNNINPWGERAVSPVDWVQKLKALNSALAEKGLVLDGKGQDKVIKEIWYSVCRETESSVKVTLNENKDLAKAERQKNPPKTTRTKDAVNYR